MIYRSAVNFFKQISQWPVWLVFGSFFFFYQFHENFGQSSLEFVISLGRLWVRIFCCRFKSESGYIAISVWITYQHRLSALNIQEECSNSRRKVLEATRNDFNIGFLKFFDLGGTTGRMYYSFSRRQISNNQLILFGNWVICLE